MIDQGRPKFNWGKFAGAAALAVALAVGVFAVVVAVITPTTHSLTITGTVIKLEHRDGVWAGRLYLSEHINVTVTTAAGNTEVYGLVPIESAQKLEIGKFYRLTLKQHMSALEPCKILKIEELATPEPATPPSTSEVFTKD